MNTSILKNAIFVFAFAAYASAAMAEGSASDEIAKYREMISDGNPAEFDEMRGEELWKKPGGPNKVSLEKCDLGKGAGVVKGAYAELPRYFADTQRVQDLESRLVTCMTTLQGTAEKDITAKPFGGDNYKPEIESLVAYVVGQSKGVKMNVSLKHPKEKEAFEIGKRIFSYRAGPYDFACSTCHGKDKQRIRMQDLPNFNNKKDAQAAYTTWPAYRVSQGMFRSFQWRLNDCLRQQRFPEPKYASELTINLTMFMAVNANDAVYDGPGLKR
ncbi:MAG: sulfur oxidation c-type cytochrome SoxA [Nitrosomonadales bacterium]|nr:sulfur oxidation c-type cytochrome SoxA [Nitrosomonadales bacterium]